MDFGSQENVGLKRQTQCGAANDYPQKMMPFSPLGANQYPNIDCCLHRTNGDAILQEFGYENFFGRAM